MSTPRSKLWEWWRVNGAAVSPIVAAVTVISGGTYWIGTVHSNLAKDLAHERELREQQAAKERELLAKERELREQQAAKERELREQQVAKERELREQQVAKERELREQQVAKERELRDSEVRALRSQLKMQQETAKKMMDDAVQAKLFQIQNVQEYAGHSISKHPAPSSG
jgi:flagellar biosynthesis GTPase FlhF